MTPKPLLFTRLGATCAAVMLAVPGYLVLSAQTDPSAGLVLQAQRSRVVHSSRIADGRVLSGLLAADGRRLGDVMPPGQKARPVHTGSASTHRSHPARKPTHVAGLKRGKPSAPARAAAPKRWLPSGTGMWTHIWSKTDGGDPRRVIKHARSAGLSTIFLRTGSSHDGFIGAPALRGLLPRLPGTGVHVVAWDFPTLADPVKDARRLSKAAWFGRTARSRVMAVAPDIETPAEGTHTSAARVRTYLWNLRRMLPKDVAILGTTPWPSRYRIGSYPYGQVAHFSDALLPMTYWYDNSPSTVTVKSMRYLKRFGRPVMPVGQGYDSRLDVPSLPASHPAKELHGFFTTAHKSGAQGVSLWSWQTAGRVQWSYLSRARHGFPPKH